MKKFYYQGLEFLVPVEVENYAMAIKRNISFQDQAQIEFRKKYQQYGDIIVVQLSRQKSKLFIMN